MKKVFRFLAFSLRLTFLPLFENSNRRKWQAAFIIVSYSALMFAVFIVCIHPQRSTFRQVDEAYGTEQAVLDRELNRLHEIIFKNARHSNPNMITIVPTAVLEAQQKQDSINSSNSLSLDDQLFLLEIINHNK
jgi:hypothetical protein